MDIITYALAKQYADKVAGAGGGATITNAVIDENNHLKITFSNGNTIDAGEIPSTSPGVLTRLENLEESAITKVNIAGQEVEVKSNTLDLPLASGTMVGLVKGADPDSKNKVSINEDGTMTVNNISLSKVIQEDGEVLYLNCSSSVG